MKEFRRAKRRKLPQEVKVIDLMTEQVIGTIGNLSESGMLLIGNQLGNEDALYQLRFELPLGAGGSHGLEVGAHLLWIDHTMAPTTYWTGYRFVDLDPADIQRLRAWIEQPGATYA